MIQTQAGMNGPIKPKRCSLQARAAIACTLSFAFVVSGCADLAPTGNPLSATVRDCMKQRTRFVDAWGCVQTRYASGQMGDADAKLGAFLKLGDDLAGKVSAKEMSEAEAKTQLTAGAANMDRS